ncbi:hypothetical protein HDF26_004276 [Pedobacter cryoconitis]|nr:hypothetical protein [Pedobacter cryoconitis]
MGLFDVKRLTGPDLSFLTGASLFETVRIKLPENIRTSEFLIKVRGQNSNHFYIECLVVGG